MEKEYNKIVAVLKTDYAWDLERLDPETKQMAEALLHYAIKAIKSELINTPQHNEFTDAVKSEMAHHAEKWGDESYAPPHHFNMVIGFLNGKLAKSVWDKDKDKFEHHLKTTAAVAGTAMKYLKKEDAETNKWFIVKQN